MARELPNRVIYMNPESSIEKKWFCSNCNICFYDKGSYVRHIERHEHCSMNDISKQKCYQLICKRYFPISVDTSPQMNSNIYCQPTQENNKEEDLLHMDFSQDFADELPEIHVGKTDEVTSTVENYIGDDITPYIWTKILFAFIYSKCHLSLVDSLEALKNPNITISKDPMGVQEVGFWPNI
jgi:hypothetical protein